MHYIIHKMRSVKGKVLLVTVIILAVYTLLCYIFFEIWLIKKNAGITMKSITIPHVIVHFDFKGAPLKIPYLITLLPLLKKFGVTGLLLEYEDMFPYEGKLRNITATNYYKKAELKEFIRAAVGQGFEVIPLVQTLGHLEHVLKLKEFRHLREEPRFPDSLCPSKHESKALVTHMLEQVIQFHSSIFKLKYIHVGCDEVFQINKCQSCIRRQITKQRILVGHVKFVSETVKKLSNDTTILIWDDMFRDIVVVDMSPFKDVEPVTWNYDTSTHMSHIAMYNYHKMFNGIWIASAFKGADGKDSWSPMISNRLENHYNWLQYIANYKFGGEQNTYIFRGLIMTGWSRYSHMDPLCDLLPFSMTSLVYNLHMIQRFRTGTVTDVLINASKAGFNLAFDPSETNPNDKEMDLIEQLDSTLGEIEQTHIVFLLTHFKGTISYAEYQFHSDFGGILSCLEYYSMINNINVNSIFKINDWGMGVIENINKLENDLKNVMRNFYYQDTIDEFINSKTFTVKKKISNVLNILENYTTVMEWGRRPYNMSFIDNVK